MKPRISVQFPNDQILTENLAIAEEFRVTQLSAIAGFYCILDTIQISDVAEDVKKSKGKLH